MAKHEEKYDVKKCVECGKIYDYYEDDITMCADGKWRCCDCISLVIDMGDDWESGE